MAVGRQTVAPRETITSQWGNWAWDQTVQTFADKPSRASQFPNPQRGACCALDDHPGLLMMWNGTAWMAEQRASVVMSTDANSIIVLTFPKPFAGVPSMRLQGDANTTFTVLVAPIASQIYADRVNLIVRTAGAGGIAGAPSTSVGFAYAAYGPI